MAIEKRSVLTSKEKPGQGETGHPQETEFLKQYLETNQGLLTQLRKELEKLKLNEKQIEAVLGITFRATTRKMK